MRKPVAFLLLFLSTIVFAHAQVAVEPPDKIYGSLFVNVQMSRVFADGKTFVDCIPKKSPSEILRDYEVQKKTPAFDLRKFVEENFEVPAAQTDTYRTNAGEDVETHIKNLWSVLKRTPDKVIDGSSLLPLPYPYIVPGGRFREVYYWDSYFTMLGLKESNEIDMIENMVKNFAYLIENYGHIPNGNRTYYLGRSQPPFFSVMVELLAEVKGDSIYQAFLPSMQKEYEFWMDGSDKIKPGQAYRRIVRMPNGDILNRYWDDIPAPRQESYREDYFTALNSHRNKVEMYHHLRAAAESGIDFSSRWFSDTVHLSSIETTDFLPVDLNSLMYHLELTIAKARLINKEDSASKAYFDRAKSRSEKIDKYFWNKKMNFYTDFNFKTKRQSNMIVPAGMYPFCFINEHPDYMSFLGEKIAQVVRKKLLQPGGVTASAFMVGQQWDAPNGWAPLEWMTIWGLDRCGQKDLAAEIAKRWITLNVKVYKESGKLMEKYNVSDINKGAGGGEYPGQDGFGWTNGVLLHLIKLYGMPAN